MVKIGREGKGAVVFMLLTLLIGSFIILSAVADNPMYIFEDDATSGFIQPIPVYIDNQGNIIEMSDYFTQSVWLEETEGGAYVTDIGILPKVSYQASGVDLSSIQIEGFYELHIAVVLWKGVEYAVPFDGGVFDMIAPFGIFERRILDSNLSAWGEAPVDKQLSLYKLLEDKLVLDEFIKMIWDEACIRHPIIDSGDYYSSSVDPGIKLRFRMYYVLSYKSIEGAADIVRTVRAPSEGSYAGLDFVFRPARAGTITGFNVSFSTFGDLGPSSGKLGLGILFILAGFMVLVAVKYRVLR